MHVILDSTEQIINFGDKHRCLQTAERKRNIKYYTITAGLFFMETAISNIFQPWEQSFQTFNSSVQ